MNGEDFNKKFEMANSLFEEESYVKALPLYEELRKVFLGQDQMKTVLYNLAQCEYEMGDLYLAAYHYSQFYDAYPYSKNSEDALFMQCKCLFETAPKKTLDQQTSQKAIKALEEFTSTYPQSDRIDECNGLIDQLHTKMEAKKFESASLYHKIGDHKASVWSLENFLRDFPSSSFSEQAHFMMLESSYKLAKNSIHRKQEERYVALLGYFKSFKENYPNSKFSGKAKNYADNSKEELNKLLNNK